MEAFHHQPPADPAADANRLGRGHALIAEAMQGGGISKKERALLNRVRDTLGIAKADADALERDLQQGTASAA